ncbi:hypothetical protein AAG570_010076 [Ranatra chinensis]|uniref:BRO1 domain-containing protein n=1 Tax=Ranatra chinensis TaxID=642074 RepID=A0ABD0Z3M3_9HEMI
MADLLSVPLKKPSEVDLVKPLSNLISSTYSTADKPEDYSEQISELNKLRNTAVWRAFEKYESSLEVIYGYYDQLHALEAKIPPNDVQIPFKWKDAFNKGSLFGGRISLTLFSLSYEKVCVLFNIAALQSAVAATQSIESDEGLKLAAKLFQQASGIFTHLKNSVISAIQVEPTPDLSPETLSALASIMLAQAQEIFVYKAIRDRMKDGIIAKLCSQCEDYYADALKLTQKETVRHIWEKEWLPTIAGKQAAMHGLAEYYQSMTCKVNRAVGEEIARLQNSLELLKAGQSKSGRNMFQEYVNRVERGLVEAKKENDFIYHDRVPEVKFLAAIPKAALAKPISLPTQLSSNFKDLFQDLVPMPVHQAMAAYDVRKNELITREINELRTATYLLNGVLASLNLPAALEDTLGEEVPMSLVEKSQTICDLGGIRRLDAMITELPDLLQRNMEILNEAERMLNEEKASDDQLREQFRERWSRTSSDKLAENFRINASKYRELINNAISADKIIKEKYEKNKNGMMILSQGIDAMKAALPKCGNQGGSSNTPACQRLRQLMEEVETLKAERDSIECELKSPTTDIKETFLNSLSNEGSINEALISTESLGRSYGSLQQQVKESINKQQELLSKIQETNSEFTMERTGSGGLEAKREAVLKELATAHDAYKELQTNLNDGTKFYNDLTQMLVVFQNKISDFCFARKTEKEELLKDMTQDLSRGSAGTTPTPPSHHNTVYC